MAGTKGIMIVGVGGQGTLLASRILGSVLMGQGYDVKMSEVHGMSQRGGSVASDVRFGPHVHSPMIPYGQADCLMVIAPDQIEVNRYALKEGGVLVSPDSLDKVTGKLQAKSINVALLGVLSKALDIPVETWEDAIRANLAEKHHRLNLEAFHQGRNAVQ